MAKSKRRKSWGMYIGLLIGVLLLAAPFAYSAINQRDQNRGKVNYMRQVDKGEWSKKLVQARQYNESIFRQQQATGKADGSEAGEALMGSLKKSMGYISIPSIKLDPLMVYYGTSDWALQRGIGNLPWTSLPVGGRSTMSILTGHSGLANQIYFDNIRHLKRGDIVYLNTFGKKLAYAVTNRIVIDPKDQSQYQKLNIKPGRDEIGLLTCTPLFVNTHRLIVFAKRVPLKDASKRTPEYRNWWSVEHLIILAISLFILVLLGLTAWHQWRKRHGKE